MKKIYYLIALILLIVTVLFINNKRKIKFTFIEGDGITNYDVSGDRNDEALTNATLADFWANKTTTNNYSQDYGFTMLIPDSNFYIENDTVYILKSGTYKIEYK
jgi:hypothetical protein